jgi:hypothetical protein
MIKRIKRAIKNAFQATIRPEQSFKNIGKTTFEDITSDYILLLLASGIVAALVSILLNLGQALYFNIFFATPIQFLRMLNYAAGIGTSIFFLYLFSGTVFFFIVSLIFKAIFSKVKLTLIISAMMYSLSPLLLFSWLPFSKIAFGVWSIVIFIVGMKTLKKT